VESYEYKSYQDWGGDHGCADDAANNNNTSMTSSHQQLEPIESFLPSSHVIDRSRSRTDDDGYLVMSPAEASKDRHQLVSSKAHNRSAGRLGLIPATG
jgi:hypothetical protein